MHVEKVKIDEGSSVVPEENAIPEEEISYKTYEELLKGDIPQPKVSAFDSQNDSDEVEYEYVSLSEATEGIAAKVRYFLAEHSMPVLIGLILLIGLFITNIAQHVNSVLIAIGFVILITVFLIALYIAYKEKKEAEERYEYALKIQKKVKDRLREDIPEDSPDSIEESEGESE